MTSTTVVPRLARVPARAAAVVLSFALAFVPAAPTAAIDTVVVAGPGGPYSTYTQPVAFVEVGATLTFVNVDAFLHDVVATDAGADDQPWCGGTFPETDGCPLFFTPLIGLSGTHVVLGTDRLDPGELYGFYCTVHTNMSGFLVALPG